MRRKKINIVVGGTFHFPMLLSNLLDLNFDVKVYTSTPKFKFRGQYPSNSIVTIIKPFQIINKLFGFSIPRWGETVDEILFDYIVSILLTPCDLLIGFQNASYFSARKIKSNNGLFLLDRACPHAREVSSRLFKEAQKLGLKFEMPTEIQFRRYEEEYRMADKILIPSDYSINSFIKMGVPVEKIVKMRLGAKIEIPKKICNLPSNLVIGAVGGDPLRKGLFYLIKAFDSLPLSDAKLLIKTSKKQIMDHKKMREIIESNKNIEIVGYEKDINSFYKRCSVFCVPSIDDGFGMVVCEAMANGLAVITTTATGASELLTDGVDGFIIPPGEVGSLEEKLFFFSDNPEERTKMGQAAYKKYLSYETSNSNYKSKLNELLETLI